MSTCLPLPSGPRSNLASKAQPFEEVVAGLSDRSEAGCAPTEVHPGRRVAR